VSTRWAHKNRAEHTRGREQACGPHGLSESSAARAPEDACGPYGLSESSAARAPEDACGPYGLSEPSAARAPDSRLDADAQVHEVALVARARRELLLRVHRHRLRREDLEDCYGQAVLELLAHARRGARFAGRLHIARTIEQRFVSRINDRRRALSGRSPMLAALETAASLEVSGARALALKDPRPEPERLVLLRHELRRIHELARRLTPEQRLVIATQVGLAMGAGEFCELHGWSTEKYRKVAQRGRARLRQLMLDDEQAVPRTGARSEQPRGTGL
jgi:DNA-directed RNA polymerase specialized sigma24 family protein